MLASKCSGSRQRAWSAWNPRYLPQSEQCRSFFLPVKILFYSRKSVICTPRGSIRLLNLQLRFPHQEAASD
jgi:hypothetical protein